MALRNGNPSAHGGKREGAGRKPDWLKDKCRKLIDDNKLLEFVVGVANGDEKQTVVVKDGHSESHIEKIPCDTKDRLRAVEMLLERGYGRPAQELQHTTDTPGRFIVVCPGYENTPNEQ